MKRKRNKCLYWPRHNKMNKWDLGQEKSDVAYQKHTSDISAKGLYEKIAKGYFLKNAQSVVKNVRAHLWG